MKVRTARLVERIVHLAEAEKELRSCFNKMTNICTCKTEDYTSEIVFEDCMTTTEVYVEQVRTYKRR